MLDLVIVGGGIAGITAAIYAKRAGFEDYKFFEKGMLGGQIKFIDKIDNFPGGCSWYRRRRVCRCNGKTVRRP